MPLPPKNKKESEIDTGISLKAGQFRPKEKEERGKAFRLRFHGEGGRLTSLSDEEK